MPASIQTTIIPGKTSLQQIYNWVTARPDYVRVGLPDTPHAQAQLTIAEIGAIHEFGAPRANIPERPFLHPAMREGADQIERLSKVLLFELQNGETTKDVALESLGLLGVRLVQEKIREGEFVPLKPATIARKGSSKPLIDTGQMIQSVTFQIER